MESVNHEIYQYQHEFDWVKLRSDAELLSLLQDQSLSSAISQCVVYELLKRLIKEKEENQ
jgi:hypothetical protein